MVDFNSLVGKTMTSELEQEIEESGLDVRIMKPGYCYTCDWDPFRMNIDVDENNIVTGTHTG